MYLRHSCLTMFADDSENSKAISSPQYRLLLQSELDLLAKRSQSSQLSFNTKKCVLLWFGSGESSDVYKYTSMMNGSLIVCTSHVNLGTTITSTMSWSPHNSILLARAYRTLGLIKRVVPYNSGAGLKCSLYLTLVTSTLPTVHLFGRRSYCKIPRNREVYIQHRATKYLISNDIDYKSKLRTARYPPSWGLHSTGLYIHSCSLSKQAQASLSHYPQCLRNFYYNRVIKLWNFLSDYWHQELLPIKRYRSTPGLGILNPGDI